MRKLNDIHTVGFEEERLIVAHTADEIYERPAIIIDTRDKDDLSIDLMYQNSTGIYHVARLNVNKTSRDDSINIDICLPDDNIMNILQWNNGNQIINVHDSHNLLALSIKMIQYANDRL